MASVRMEKVSRLIQHELSHIFLHKLNDPMFGFVTITKVKLTPDLKIARAYISVYDKEKRVLILEKLSHIKKLIRTELAGRVLLRAVPDLEFYIDDTSDYVEKMENLFKKIHKDDYEKDDRL